MLRRPRAVRDLAIAIGAWLAAVGFLISAVAMLLSMIAVIRIGLAPTSYNIGKGLDVGHDLVLVGAFALVGVAVSGPIVSRERRLGLAAIIAALGFAVWVVAQALYGTSEPRGGSSLATSDVLDALTAGILAAASLTTAVAFRRAESSPPEDQSQRDGLLLWAAAGLAIGLALSAASAINYLDAVLLDGSAYDGLRLSAIGIGVGMAGATTGTVAFFVSRRKQERGSANWMSSREALIASALGIFVLGFVLAGIGNALLANASPDGGTPEQLLRTGHWLEAVAAWTLGASTALVAAGFLVSSRRGAIVAAS